MNDSDLERRLRSETGPRERGYIAHGLPPSPDGRTPRPSRGLRFAAVIPAAAGIVAVAVVGAMLGGNEGPDVGADGSPSPTLVPSVIGGMPVCTNDGLTMSAERWGGAAGSRGTVVTVQLAQDHATCALIPSDIAARMSDVDGNTLITSEIPQPMSRDVIEVRAGDLRAYSVVWSNWCGDRPAPPVGLSVSVEEGTHWTAIAAPGDGADPVPPCLGQNAPSNLTVTALPGAQ
jgi:hypothetical protein